MAALFPEDITISDDFLTCRLCQKKLNKPKLLPCQHTFCKDCLIKTITPSDFTVTCPCCERIVQVENGDIDQIPDNYLFPIILEKRAAPIEYCLPCQFDNKKTKATHKCLDCQDTFCNECEKFHNFSSLTRNHINIKDVKKGKYRNEMKLKKMRKCQKHSTKESVLSLDLYCKDCQCLVCKHGVTSLEHHAHSCTLVDTFEKKERATLNDTLQQIGDIQKKESRFSDHLDNTSQSLKKEREAAENQVDKAADKLYALVDKVKEDKFQEIKNHYEEELEKVKVIKLKQQQLRNQTKTMKTFTEAFLHHISTVEFLSHFKDVEYRVKDFLERKEDTFITTKHLHIVNKPCYEAIEIVRGILGKASIQKKKSKERRKIEVLKENGDLQVLLDIKLEMEEIRGLSVTEENDIIAVGGSKISVFSNDGRHKRWIHCEELTEAGDVTVKGNIVYIADDAEQKRKILAIDMNGMLQRAIRMPDSKQIDFFSWNIYKLSLAVDNNDNIYISSELTHTLYKCTPQSTVPQTFLTDSTKPGPQSPQSLCITPKQELVVSNRNNILAYNGNGKLLWQYDGRDGRDRRMKLYNSTGVCCDQEGNVYVADCENHRIQVVNGGAFIGSIEPKALEFPSDLTLNSNHELIILNCRKNIMKVNFQK